MNHLFIITVVNIISAFIILALGVTVGQLRKDSRDLMETISTLRKQAVEHGAAEWVTDSAGNSTFTWKDKK